MKWLFDCGHRGKGQFCHRCDQADRLRDEARNRSPGVAGALVREADRLETGATVRVETSVRRAGGRW